MAELRVGDKVQTGKIFCNILMDSKPVICPLKQSLHQLIIDFKYCTSFLWWEYDLQQSDIIPEGATLSHPQV